MAWSSLMGQAGPAHSIPAGEVPSGVTQVRVGAPHFGVSHANTDPVGRSQGKE